MPITPLPIPKPYQRLGSFPLDITDVWSTLAALTTYASSNASAYAGQILACSENNLNTVYVINNDLTVTLIGSGGASNPSIQTDDTILKGQPVYIKANGHIGLAKADALLTSKVVGFAVANAAIGFSCEYQRNLLTLTDWTNVIGTTNLTVNNIYYLSAATAGIITSTSPTSGGQVVISLGEAISTTSLEINIEQTILL